jgi:hypothetical protein
LSKSRFGYSASTASGSTGAACASADVAEIVEIRAAAASVFSPVIVILHFAVLRALATSAPGRRSLRLVLPTQQVAIAAEKNAPHPDHDSANAREFADAVDTAARPSAARRCAH